MIGSATKGKTILPACVQTLLNGIVNGVLWHGSSRQTGGIIRIRPGTARGIKCTG